MLAAPGRLAATTFGAPITAIQRKLPQDRASASDSGKYIRAYQSLLFTANHRVRPLIISPFRPSLIAAAALIASYLRSVELYDRKVVPLKIKLSVIGERTGRDVYRRWPNAIPILCAFVRRAPSVRLNSLETFLTGNFSREYCFKDRRSSFVHSFRLRFVFLAIITPWLFRTLYSA